MKAAVLNEKHTDTEGNSAPRWEQFVPVKEYYTIQDVCIILRVGGPQVYNAIKRGTLAGVYINQVKHVRHTALMDYLARRSDAPVFDPDKLVITDIIPEKEAAKSAEAMLPEGAEADFDDFLGE